MIFRCCACKFLWFWRESCTFCWSLRRSFPSHTCSLYLSKSLHTDDIEVVERVVEGAEQIYVKIERTDEFITEVGVETYGHFVDYACYYDEGSVEKHHDIVVFLFIVVFFHFDPDWVVQGDDLIGQIVKKDQRSAKGLHLHWVFIVHFALEPLHELSHGYVYHLILYKSILNSKSWIRN